MVSLLTLFNIAVFHPRYSIPKNSALSNNDIHDSSLQPTIDTLLNVAIFMWYGVACPWSLFVENTTLSFSRLLILGILVLLFRRLPYIFLFRTLIPQVENRKQATFMGFFGPIGCSAMFYLYITMDFVNGLKSGDGDELREDVQFLREDVRVVVWFLMTCSVVSPMPSRFFSRSSY